MKTKTIVGIALLTLGGGALAYHFLGNKPKTTTTDNTNTALPVSKWPLKQGATNSPEVKNLQTRLLKKGGVPAAEISASGGADGTWGNGTQKAVVAAGWPTSIDEATYTKLVGEVAPFSESVWYNPTSWF